MLITICGPSCAGKDTLEKTILRDKENYDVKKITSYTTRKIRPGEKDGVDYNFVSMDKFKEMINNNELLEYVEYTPGTFYGTLLNDVIKAGKSEEIFTMIKTPDGVKDIIKTVGEDYVLVVGIDSPLKTKVERFVNRAGNDFNMEQMDNLYYRIKNDDKTFADLKEISDIFINNDGTTDIDKFAGVVVDEAKRMICVNKAFNYEEEYDY